MGNRLSKIYTRTGDKGTTGLGDGSRINKDHPRMDAIGTVDELNSHIGLLICELAGEEPLRDTLTRIQHHLFDLGGELCIPGYRLIKGESVTWLEESMDALNNDLPPLKNFILPGGNKAAAQCHLARAVCRRAERHIISLSHSDEGQVNAEAVMYINRLSDYLFIAARTLARRDDGEEVLWQQAQ